MVGRTNEWVANPLGLKRIKGSLYLCDTLELKASVLSMSYVFKHPYHLNTVHKNSRLIPILVVQHSGTHFKIKIKFILFQVNPVATKSTEVDATAVRHAKNVSRHRTRQKIGQRHTVITCIACVTKMMTSLI